MEAWIKTRSLYSSAPFPYPSSLSIFSAPTTILFTTASTSDLFLLAASSSMHSIPNQFSLFSDLALVFIKIQTTINKPRSWIQTQKFYNKWNSSCCLGQVGFNLPCGFPILSRDCWVSHKRPPIGALTKIKTLMIN